MIYIKPINQFLNESLNNEKEEYVRWGDLPYETKDDIISNLVDSKYDLFSRYHILGGSWLLDDIDKEIGRAHV